MVIACPIIPPRNRKEWICAARQQIRKYKIMENNGK
jgi:hypothetical protein